MNKNNRTKSNGSNTSINAFPDAIENSSNATVVQEVTQIRSPRPEHLAWQVFGPDTLIKFVKVTDSRLPLDFRRAWTGSPNCKIPVVVCGPESKGLCVLVLPSSQSLFQFITENPFFPGTLITNAEGFFYVWMRVSGWRAPNLSWGGVEWYSSGYVMLKGDPRLIIPRVSPIFSTKFDSVRWPWEMAPTVGRQQIIAEHGEFYLGAEKPVLNLDAFSRLISIGYKTRYSIEWKTFYTTFLGRGEIVMLTDADVIEAVTELLNLIASKCPTDFPMDELRPSRVKELVERLKVIAAIPSMTEIAY